MTYKLIQASAHQTNLPDKSIHMIATSPPYYGLRAYSGEQAIEWPAVSYSPMPGLPPMTIAPVHCGLGAEPTPEMFIGHLILVMREMWRVLRDDGTCWVNLGDSYATGQKGGIKAHEGDKSFTNKGGLGIPRFRMNHGLKDKDLMLIPYRFALAVQADGWYVRSDIIWNKGNCMPESVTDRPTRSHEYIYMLAKSERYYYDSEAIKEPAKEWTGRAATFARNGAVAEHILPGQAAAVHRSDRADSVDVANGRNKRSVWHINTHGNSAAHFATFPLELPTICIKAGTSEYGVCAKCGAPWERVTEKDNPPHDGTTTSASATGTTANRMSILRQAARERGEEYVNRTITTGWRATCTCNAAIVPATVLDPFNGSGTSGKAAMKLGRSYIGVDISETYITDLCEDDNRAANGLPKLLTGAVVDYASMPLFAEVLP